MSYEKTHPPLASLRPSGAHPCLRRDTHMAHAQTFNPGMIPITFPFRVPFSGCPLWPCPVSDRRSPSPRPSPTGPGPTDRSLGRSATDGAATQQRTAGFQKLRNSGEYRLRQLVALQEMPEVQDGRLVGNCVASELQTCERAHRADVVMHFFRAGIGEVVPCCRQ